ncbi:MAG: hypothetical protein KDB07_06445 [Planctomycetes bacterium]|nr:hypothetical protein [Planctomycetota bacterium]
MFEIFLNSRSFSIGGSGLVIASLLVPFFVAYLVSVFENRLLYYFSEGRLILTKGNLVGSVISTTVVPFFMISFGLLVVSQWLGEDFQIPELAPGEFPVPTAKQALVYIPLTIIASMLLVGLIHRAIVARKLADTPSVQRLLNRWVFGLSMVSQVLIVGFLWAVLFLFPAQANTQIN